MEFSDLSYILRNASELIRTKQALHGMASARAVNRTPASAAITTPASTRGSSVTVRDDVEFLSTTRMLKVSEVRGGGLPADDNTGAARQDRGEGAGIKLTEGSVAEVEGLSGGGGPEEGLEGVDMGEQRRIMHEIWMRKNLQKPTAAAGQRKSVKRIETQGAPKQPRLTDMFSKKS